jgi:uncharacterized protein YfiM (DUF2279 family)
MKRALIIVFLILITTNSGFTKTTPPPADSVNVFLKRAMHDKWFGEDKAHHFMVSAALTGFSYYAAKQELGMSQKNSNVAAIGVTFSIGIAKEVYDGVSGKGNVSLQDVVADVAGIVLGVVILNVSQ